MYNSFIQPQDKENYLLNISLASVWFDNATHVDVCG